MNAPRSTAHEVHLDWLWAALDRVTHALETPDRSPRYRSVWAWLGAGCARQPRGIVAGLLAGWTSLLVALWFGAIAGVAGGVAAIVGTLISPPTRGVAAAGGAQALASLGVVGGMLLGALGGFVVSYGGLLFAAPLTTVVSLLSGAILAVLIVGVMVRAEPTLLRLQGYGRLSRKERARLLPRAEEAARRMGLPTLPSLLIADNLIPGAWAHPRTIVVTTGLLELNDAELDGVLAHELHHWAVGDPVGLLIVWACSWPVALLYNLGVWLSGGGQTVVQGGAGQVTVRMPGVPSDGRILLAAVGWLILWPSWVLTTLLLAPIIAAASRRQEYEADAAAARAGYGAGLAAALTQLRVFEGGRTGWEAAIAAHHPRTELRLEALDELRDDGAT